MNNNETILLDNKSFQNLQEFPFIKTILTVEAFTILQYYLIKYKEKIKPTLIYTAPLKIYALRSLNNYYNSDNYSLNYQRYLLTNDKNVNNSIKYFNLFCKEFIFGTLLGYFANFRNVENMFINRKYYENTENFKQYKLNKTIKYLPQKSFYSSVHSMTLGRGIAVGLLWGVYFPTSTWLNNNELITKIFTAFGGKLIGEIFAYPFYILSLARYDIRYTNVIHIKYNEMFYSVKNINQYFMMNRYKIIMDCLMLAVLDKFIYI